MSQFFTSTTVTQESLDFFQERVSRFGLLAGAISIGYWLYRLLYGLLISPRDLLEASFYLHLCAAGCFFLIWLLCRGGSKPLRYVQTVEEIGLLAACVTYSIMGLYIPALARPDLLLVLAFFFGLVARAVVVPSSARHTLILGIALGIPLLFSIYLSYSDFDSKLWTSINERVSNLTSRQVAIDMTVNGLVFWALIVGLCTAISRVIYGLRREVRNVKKLGQYTLIDKIGEGGMGEVYRATHALLQRPTAIKLLRTDKMSERAIARFKREVQLTSQLTHPNTIAIYDYGHTADGVFYYAMEYLDGLNLESLVDLAGPLPASRTIHILRQICRSLSEAHGRGLVHRDIKPANIILCERGDVNDVAKVLDFGLVKDVENEAGDAGDAAVSQIGSITGTPLYMAPETLRAMAKIDARADLYAVGAVGYFLLTGTHVFQGTSVMEIISDHLRTPPQPPSERTGSPLPADIEKLILKSLAKSAEDRQQGAREFLAELDACEDAGNWTEDDARCWWETRAAEGNLGDKTKRSDETSDGLDPQIASDATQTIDVQRP